MHCAQLYNTIWFDVSGQIAPCCFYKPQINGGTNSLQSYITFLEPARRAMSQGQWPIECGFCKDQEQGSGRSERLNYNIKMRDWGVDPERIKIHTLGIFIGNKCNLHCATCDAKYSTGWIKPARNFNMPLFPVMEFDTARLDCLAGQLDELRELNITGGEAMYQGGLHRIIEYLSQHADLSRCRIRFATNGTLRPDDDLLALWNRFESVEITISADAYGKMFEYIRHPADWETVASNIEFYRGLGVDLSCNCLITPMNVWYMDDIARNHFRLFGTGTNFLGAQKRIWELWNMPDLLKQCLAERLGKLGYAQKILSQIQAPVRDSEAWQDFRSFIRTYDRQWGLDFEATFPEWSVVIKEHDLW